MKQLICIFLTYFSLIYFASAQTIWEENFEGPIQGWTENHTNCDGRSEAFAGVRNGRFEVQNMEGGPCCGEQNDGGGNNNEWVTDSIAIVNFCNVTISIDYGWLEKMECASPNEPIFGCSGDPIVDNSHDQLVFEYQLDGDDWVLFEYLCTEESAGNQAATVNGLNGEVLRIRIRAANKAVDEVFYWDNVSVTAETSARVSFGENPAFSCDGSPITVEAFSVDSLLGTFTWSINGTEVATFSNTTSSAFEVGELGEQEVEVVFESDCGQSAINQMVNILPAVSLDSIAINGEGFMMDMIAEGLPISLRVFGDESLNDFSFEWTENGRLLNASNEGIIVTPQDTGMVTYTVVLEREGCLDSLSRTIQVKAAQFQIPNAFAPESNIAENQRFQIFYIGNYVLNNLSVYSRWGKVVFETSNIDEAWDGTNNGNELPSDVYVYVATLTDPDGLEVMRRGEVVLLR